MIAIIIALTVFFFVLDFGVPYTLLFYLGGFWGSGRQEHRAFRRAYGIIAWPRTAALIAAAVLCGLSGHYNGEILPLFVAGGVSGAAWFLLLARDFVRAARQT
jgi:hypothetical protein